MQNSPEPEERMTDWLVGVLELFWKVSFCSRFLRSVGGELVLVRSDQGCKPDGSTEWIMSLYCLPGTVTTVSLKSSITEKNRVGNPRVANRNDWCQLMVCLWQYIDKNDDDNDDDDDSMDWVADKKLELLFATKNNNSDSSWYRSNGSVMVSYLSGNSKMQLWWQAEPYLDFFL